MKKRFIILCTITTVALSFLACGNKDNTVDNSTISQETTQETDNTVSEENTDTTSDESNETEEVSSSEDEDTSEVDYSVFTDRSSTEVEAYAKTIRDAALASDWDTIGDMISYPVADPDGNTCNNKEEFIEYANNIGFDKSFYDSLEKWTVSDLWGNYQGGCIDNGNIWFADIYVDDTNREFRIIAFWRLTMK